MKQARLTSGILKGYADKIQNHLVNNVDCEKHARTYIDFAGDQYAEPEFTGKYVDLNMKIYRATKNEKALENAAYVVSSIINNMRDDGFCGCLEAGKEAKFFAVWNQMFTIMGLLSYYRETQDEKVLAAAEKCANYIIDCFADGKNDILNAVNYKTQHITIFYAICDLYELTGKKEYQDFMFYIIDRIKNSDINFFEFENIMELWSKKGIENFVILLSMLKYYKLFGDKNAFDAVKKYWQQVNDTQIRNTGNGTINEFWTENGNQAMLLSESQRPNENCVAVGWIELSLALFYLEQDKKYLDAIDKTMYNHILGAIAEDGTDFAYYQPNYGKKVRTINCIYQCCRYRGFTIFTYMDEMLYFEDKENIIPMLYTDSEYITEEIEIVQKTNYPFDNVVSFFVKTKDVFQKTLKLRIPEKRVLKNVIINGENSSCEVVDGYVEFKPGCNQELKIELIFDCDLLYEFGMIDDQEHVAISFGNVLLAMEDIDQNISLKKEKLDLQCDTTKDSFLKYSGFGYQNGEEIKVKFTDYASADNYRIWIPIIK